MCSPQSLVIDTEMVPRKAVSTGSAPLTKVAREDEFQREMFKMYAMALVFSYLKLFLERYRTYIHLIRAF